MNLKQRSNYKKGTSVKFFYFYEDKVGIITEVDGTKYEIQQTSNKIKYVVTVDKIYGEIIEDKNENKLDTGKKG